MKILMTKIGLPFLLLLMSAVPTIAVADVTIVYPFAGSIMPKTDPIPPQLSSSYVPISFVVVCPGGPYSVKWLIDNQTNGEADFYDQITIQYIQKLPGGGHHLLVETSDERCGRAEIKFEVGN